MGHIIHQLPFAIDARTSFDALQENLRQVKTVDSSLASVCSLVNSELKTSFNLRQRQNIDDFIQYLDGFFQPLVVNYLEVEKWLVCTNGE